MRQKPPNSTYRRAMEFVNYKSVILDHDLPVYAGLLGESQYKVI